MVCRAGHRPPRVMQDGTREMLTLVECCCAVQYMLHSFVIFKGTAQYMGWHSETSDPDAMIACSPNGWTDDELGLESLYHFDHCTKDRKRGSNTPLLILDGHRSHLSLKFIQYSIDNNIQLLCFPAHAIHLLQPLDIGLFAPLKKYYSKAVDDYIRNTHTGILKRTFWRFYSAACQQAYTKENIAFAFRATGICSFNPDAVTRLITGDTNPVTVPTSTIDPSSQLAVDILSQLKTPRKSRDVRQQT